MNPYLAFGIAMCAIVLLSLGLTAWMAMFFNRRAKADMEAAMAPLAALLEGEIDLEEATVSGRYLGHLATGKVVSGPAGAGRFFETSIVDGAGGEGWSWTATYPKQAGAVTEFKFEPKGSPLEPALHAKLDDIGQRRLTAPGWFRLEYDPVAGTVKFTRPMHARRDLPSAVDFQHLLDDLKTFADANRALQQIPAPA